MQSSGGRSRVRICRIGLRLILLVTAVMLVAGACTDIGAHRGPVAAAAERPSERPTVTPCTLRHAGTGTMHIGHRPMTVYVPRSALRRGRVPAVLLLHGTGGTGAKELRATRLAATANRYGFVVAAPNGGIRFRHGYAWNVPNVPLVGGKWPRRAAPNDRRYLSRVIGTLTGKGCVDSDRVYGAGFSGGGRMLSALACTDANRLAAIAPVEGLRAGEPGTRRSAGSGCRPNRPVGVFAVHGTADHTNPFDGGGQRYWHYGVLDAVNRWARIDRCSSDLPTIPLTARSTLITAADCARGKMVELLRIDGGKHQWPSRSAKAAPGLNINDMIWRSLARYRR